MTGEINFDLKNYLKLEYVLKEAREILQEEFQRRWKLIHKQVWTNSVKGRDQFTHGFGRDVYKKAGRLQKASLEEGNLNKLDITTIAQLLQTKQMKSGEDRKSKETQTSIQAIVEVRNKLAHHPTKSLNEDEFTYLCSKLCEALSSFGVPKEQLEKILSADEIGGISFAATNSTKHVNEGSVVEGNELKERGNKLFHQNKFQDAIEMYSQGISLPDLSDDLLSILYSNRSTAYLKLDRSVENIRNAADDAKRAISSRPGWWKSHFRLGCVYEAKKKFLKALSHYIQALALDPTQTEVRSALHACRAELKIRERQEHLDPNLMPMSREESLRKIQSRFGGFGVTSKQLDEKMKKLRSSGDPKFVAMADVYLAHHYLTGMDNVPQSYEQAARLFAKAATVGNAEAIYNLAALTKTGKGVDRDIPLALRLLRQAASQQPFLDKGKSIKNVGVAEAEHSLGLCYEEGVGVEPNYEEAINWYEKGSEHGCSGSSNNLGFMYANGKGVERNVKRAAQYWKLAASQGNVNAMDSLEVHYMQTGMFIRFDSIMIFS